MWSMTLPWWELVLRAGVVYALLLLLIRLYFLRYVSDGDLQAVRSPEYESGALGAAALSPARTRGPSGSP